jgi:hypothetical protein
MHPRTLQRPANKKANDMGRSRYVITEPDKPHFLNCTVVEWIPVFTHPDAVKSC